MVYALTDETYSLVCSEERRHRYYFTVSLLDQIYWVTGSVCGSLLGSIIPFNTEGIDFALTALFLTVFVEQWLSTGKHGPALAGLGASVLCRASILLSMAIDPLPSLSKPSPLRDSLR